MTEWLKQSEIRRALDYIPTPEDLTIALCQTEHRQIRGYNRYRLADAGKALIAYYERKRDGAKRSMAWKYYTPKQRKDKLELWQGKIDSVREIVEGME